MHTKEEDKLGFFVSLTIRLYTGVKINARINPKIIESKIGFNKKKDKTIRINNIIIVAIFLR